MGNNDQNNSLIHYRCEVLGRYSPFDMSLCMQDWNKGRWQCHSQK